MPGQIRSPSAPGGVSNRLRLTPCITSTMSTPPTALHRFAISLENEIRVASSAFDAYLIISAVALVTRRRGTPSNGAYSSSCACCVRAS